LVNFYFPHSGRELKRLDFKLKFNDSCFKFLKKFDSKKLVVCGDLNVAHAEIDLARPKDNRKNAGFTDAERAWMDKFVSSGFVDIYRYLYPEKQQFTWWSQRFGARARNVGWRIDYFLVQKQLLPRVANCRIETTVLGSDHCPVILELK
jgi:exodeoxyribonuclease-3